MGPRAAFECGAEEKYRCHSRESKSDLRPVSRHFTNTIVNSAHLVKFQMKILINVFTNVNNGNFVDTKEN
jgi:hypothetical protein